ncbi:hypothetical protein JZ751_019599, partial [Albula glossodonta]
PDAAEEYFEYDAEEFLVLLTLLITEGRTPECSVKGRTEGLHCPPAQSAQPVQPRHECSDKLPQCRQARRMRSEVMLFWRNNIPVMIEVMLLPDCCYSDEGPTTDGTDINDPAIKQDALLLERWTLQPVPRQSGDRFIEEKTLLLAVRSYVFFSQLSAWLSASHGIVPRNILYRISAADEELVWKFSQPPAEHAFPVPNVSHSVALKVHVQSLPRQPNYPVLKCSIHASITLFGKKGYEQEERPLLHCDITDSSLHRLRDPVLTNPTNPPSPYSVVNSKKCQVPEPLPVGMAAKWLYSRLNSSPDVKPFEGYMAPGIGAEESKTSTHELPVRTFKSLSLVDPLVAPTSNPRPPLGETSPLIGSLLQERQEVIARIAQHLNYCDPSAPHVPDSLFGGPETQAPKSPWFPREEAGPLKKCKDPLSLSPDHASPQDGSTLENRCRSSPSDTPLGLSIRARADSDLRTSPKPAACRKLLLSGSAEAARISEVVHDISRLIQDTFQQSQSRCPGLLQSTYKIIKEGNTLLEPNRTEQEGCSQSGHALKSTTPCQNATDSLEAINSNGSHICTDLKISGTKATAGSRRDHSTGPQSQACVKHEDQAAELEPKTSSGLQNAKKDCLAAECPVQNSLKLADRSLLEEAKSFKGQSQHSHTQHTQHSHLQDENHDPSASSTSTSPLQKDLSICPEAAQNGTVLRENGQVPLKPCNIWKKQNRHSIDGTATKAFHPCTGLPLLSSPECVLNHRLEPLGTVEGFMAEVGASGSFCPSHMTLPVEVSFYSVSDDNAPSPYMDEILPPCVIRDANGHTDRKSLTLSQERTLRYLINLRFQSSKSGKIYLHRDIRLLFSRKSMEVDSGAAYELKSFTESPADPPFSPR